MSDFSSALYAPPVRSRQEGPADFDLASDALVAVKPRRSDHGAGTPVEREEGAAGGQMVGEEVAEHGLPIAIRSWMLLPDQRVGGHGVQSLEVSFAERPQLDE